MPAAGVAPIVEDEVAAGVHLDLAGGPVEVQQVEASALGDRRGLPVPSCRRWPAAGGTSGRNRAPGRQF